LTTRGVSIPTTRPQKVVNAIQIQEQIMDLVQKDQTEGNNIQARPFLEPHKVVINAKELDEESVAVTATTTVKWLLHGRHC
jgi:hypothetical protein